MTILVSYRNQLTDFGAKYGFYMVVALAFNQLKMHWNVKKWSVFSREKLHLFVNTVLLQFELLLVPYLFLIQNSTFWNISVAGLFHNTVTASINFKTKNLAKTKI